MYINCPGGVVYSGLAIYDTMQFIKPDVATVCCGVAMSMGSLLPRRVRQALGAAELAHPRPPAERRLPGPATDIQIHAKEALELRRRIEEIYAHHTGKPVERSRRRSSATASSRPSRRASSTSSIR